MTLGCTHHRSDAGIHICLPVLFAIIPYLGVMHQASFASAINIHLIPLPFPSDFSHNTRTMTPFDHYIAFKILVVTNRLHSL